MLQRANLSWFLKLAACLRKFIPISSISAFYHVTIFGLPKSFSTAESIAGVGKVDVSFWSLLSLKVNG
jgi:hypothetical protein